VVVVVVGWEGSVVVVVWWVGGEGEAWWVGAGWVRLVVGGVRSWVGGVGEASSPPPPE